MDSALSRSSAEILLRIPLTGEAGATGAEAAGVDVSAGLAGAARIVSAAARAGPAGGAGACASANGDARTSATRESTRNGRAVVIEWLPSCAATIDPVPWGDPAGTARRHAPRSSWSA